MNWNDIFSPSIPLGEIVLRGTLIYIFAFALMRVARRGAGQIGITDLLIVVMLADAAQGGMAGGSNTVTEAAVLMATLVAWDYLLDWLGATYPGWERLLRPPPLLLISNGRILRVNMKKELLTMEELTSLLRHEGVDDVSTVRRCYLEGDGRLSVLREKEESPAAQ
jgi:uncharacterized membrane protein YcaP (DUF421 family)